MRGLFWLTVGLGADPFKQVDHVWRPEAEAELRRWREPAEHIHDSKGAQLRSRRQPVMDEGHGSSIIDARGCTAAFPQLCLYPSLEQQGGGESNRAT